MAQQYKENNYQSRNMPKIAETKLDRKEPQVDLEPDILELGDDGPNVALLQARLNAFEYYHGEINGQFDRITQQALKHYQTDNELSEIGYFGAETWYSMTFWKEEEHIPFMGSLLRKLRSLGYIAGFGFWEPIRQRFQSFTKDISEICLKFNETRARYGEVCAANHAHASRSTLVQAIDEMSDRLVQHHPCPETVETEDSSCPHLHRSDMFTNRF